MAKKPVYLDFNATTPVAPEVLEAMLPWLGEFHGNPSSSHSFGRRAREAVEAARSQVARLLNAEAAEVVFGASGSELNNAVLFSCAQQCSGDAETGGHAHIVVSAIEHPSILAAAKRLETEGCDITYLGVDGQGRVDPEECRAVLRPTTRLVCVMLANNEVGTVQPVARIAQMCCEQGVPVLCDAVQAVGKIPVDSRELGVDYLVVGAHKFYGPTGAAAMILKKEASFAPYLLGGSQERRRRAGTENVAAIVGMGVAAELAHKSLEIGSGGEESAGDTPRASDRLAALRDAFESELVARVPRIVLHGSKALRLPNTSHPAFLGTRSNELLMRLDLAGFAVSTGSACSSGKVEVSGTLAAMKVSAEEAGASLRISFGRTTTEKEVKDFLDVLCHEVEALRQFSQTEAMAR